MTTQKIDDLEAVRLIVDAVKDFRPEEQQRIFRWASEKLNLALPASPPIPTPLASGSVPLAGAAVVISPIPATGGVDIKAFMLQKKPRNDVQFAAAAAYFYRFEAGASERKDTISKDDLQEAARKAARERFTNPLNTLNNAHKLGLLDKGPEKATFAINSVGENLVAMTLPDGAAGAKPAKKKKPVKKVAKKQAAAKKKATKKTALKNTKKV
jgi:hypothetical protein